MAVGSYQVWAKVGAAARLAAIAEERAAILKTFPELRNAAARSASSVAEGRAKRTFSAAAKARMSAGMRKYWAKRKAAAKASAA